MIYDLLASFYDTVNRDIDYKGWADFIEGVFIKHLDKRPELLLDLACGTGRMTLELASRGYDMTGVDISPEMLDAARETEEGMNNPTSVLWLCQDMREFELYGTVDAAISCLDSMNHLTSVKDFKKTLSLVHNYLVPDGVFVFDVNGRWKFENIYADRSYVMELDDGFFIWQNDYNPKTRLCDFSVTLFSERGDGVYERVDDLQRERMYTLRSIKGMLFDEGFELLGAYSDFNFTEASDADERIYVIARCKKTV